MNMPLPKTTQGVYRLSVSTFYFLQGLVFASWASRIPDIKSGGADVRHGAIRLPGWPLRQPENTDGGIRFLSCRACMPGYGGVFLGTGGRVIFLWGSRKSDEYIRQYAGSGSGTAVPVQHHGPGAFYGRPPGDALRSCTGSARQRHPHCLGVAGLRPVPDAVVRHAGVPAGGLWHLFPLSRSATAWPGNPGK